MRRWLPWIAAYAVLLVAAVVIMIKTRDRVVSQMGTPRSIAEWQAWRSDVEKSQNEQGPVSRRVPKSAEPPALVMMRDHFAVSLAGVLLFGSALYWVSAWFVMGILQTY